MCLCLDSGSFMAQTLILLLFEIEFYVTTILAFVSKDSPIPSKTPKASPSPPIWGILEITNLHFTTTFRALLDFILIHALTPSLFMKCIRPSLCD